MKIDLRNPLFKEKPAFYNPDMKIDSSFKLIHSGTKEKHFVDI